MSLISALENLFESKADSDVSFIVQNKELRAHKIILVNRSRVLKTMIKTEMAPPNHSYEISDSLINFDDFDNFLKFLYTEKCEVNLQNVLALLRLSDMYDVRSLSQFCVEKLSKSLDVKNLFEFAETGISLKNKFGIVGKCLEEISFKSPFTVYQLQYQKKNEMVWISKELVLLFVRCCPRTNLFTENEVFKKVFKWSKGQCKEQDLEINSQNLKEIMAPFISDFKLERINIQILTTTFYKYEIIPEKQLLKLLRDYIVQDQLNPQPWSAKRAKYSASYAHSSPSFSPSSPVCDSSSPVYDHSFSIISPSSPEYIPTSPSISFYSRRISPSSPLYVTSSPSISPLSPITSPTSPVYDPNSPSFAHSSSIISPSSPVYDPYSPCISPN